MDMKPTTNVAVNASDLDKRGYMTLTRLTQLMLLAAMDRNRVEGGGRGPMRENFGAAWMFRRVKLEQFLPIREGDVLQGFGSGRTILPTEYVRRGEFRRDGELVAACDLVLIPVRLKERAKLSTAEIDRLYDCPPSNEVENFPRLAALPEVSYGDIKTITEADCDDNASHFASHNYVDLVCTELGCFDGPYRMIRHFQIDYIKECVTGDRIKLGAAEQGAGFVVQGIHEDGRPCFNAYCEYE